jgi:hypothetical protein
MGGSVPLLNSTPRPGKLCKTWYAIQPRGFVCVDGKDATLDPGDPVLAQMRPYFPKLDTPWPHQYGESRGLQRYEELPTREQQRKKEWDLEDHLARIATARQGGEVHDSLARVDLAPAGRPAFSFTDLTSTVHEPRKALKPLSTVAYSAEVDHDGRPFLLTSDLMWVPKDRVALYPRVTFHGLKLGQDAKLPLAFFRGEDRPKYEKQTDGTLKPTGEKFPRLSYVELTGAELVVDGLTYLETRDRGRFVAKRDAVVPTPQPQTPWGANVNQENTTGRAPPGRRTWMEVSVLGGWLIAYEGTTPVYVTMVSPGRGGVPVKGIDPLETASTPTGSFPISGKFATATMVAPYDFVHADVPWTQNFSGPHALHTAYWHDDWGNKKSAGCINVAPIDGRWLFDWTEPRVPEGWHGVRWQPKREPASTLVVHN